MINKNLDNHSWVAIPSLSVKDFGLILKHIEISRYATGGVDSVNKSIKEIIGDGSFWDKFIFYNGGWRLGGKPEEVLPENEIHPLHMFNDSVDLTKL